MGAVKLDNLVEGIHGSPGLSIDDQLDENLRLTESLVREMPKIIAKCDSTKQIDGQIVEIIGLTLTGQRSIEHIGITYNCNNELYFRTYTMQDFYNL